MSLQLWSERAAIALSRAVSTLADAPEAPATTSLDKKAGTWLDEGERLLTQYGMRVVGALIFLFVAWIGSRYLVRLTVRGLTKAHVDITLAKFLSNLARWGLLALVIIACLDIFGVPATSFVTVLGTVGLAIGLAVQGSISHMAAGVMLMLFRPFRVGDSVVVAGQRGVVDEIELFTTRLDTPDKRRIIIPNGQVFGAIIENLTFHQDRRVDATIQVAFGADIENTRQVLTDAAKSVTTRIQDRSPEVNMTQFISGNVEWTVVIWASAEEAPLAKQALLKQVKEGLEVAGIDMPMPQMVINAGKGIGIPASGGAAAGSRN